MRAGQDRGHGGVSAITAAIDVAHPVDADGQAGLFHPRDDPATPGRVGIGQSQAVDAAQAGALVVVRADLGEVHQRLPQTVAVEVIWSGVGLIRSCLP
ncbi:hypothetical protein [Streptomyces sp. TP-A0356]|uniref:hypothetical protein n=1 Tax=Streptomyces sp. TP-A0356 TaxID=1359208 RepID=UPI0006E16AE9|nr:hypothetical protein [Streptomyces sp. TP-A0356]